MREEVDEGCEESLLVEKLNGGEFEFIFNYDLFFVREGLFFARGGREEP